MYGRSPRLGLCTWIYIRSLGWQIIAMARKVPSHPREQQTFKEAAFYRTYILLWML